MAMMLKFCLLSTLIGTALSGVLDGLGGATVPSVETLVQLASDAAPPRLEAHVTAEKPATTSSLGFTLAFMGGLSLAVGALAASYSERMGKDGLWTDGKVGAGKGVSGLMLAVGGILVALAYQQPGSVPVMAVIVYATNLLGNMLFQIVFKLSTYNKVMRCGTFLFAFVTVQLSDLSPPAASDTKVGLLLAPLSLVWLAIFACIWASAYFATTRVKHLPRTAPLKQAAFALFIASCGSLLDNWSKVTGTFVGTPMYFVSFGLWGVVAFINMVLTVNAMSVCDVAIYVPANLCCQLILNLTYDYMVWGAAARVEEPIPYLSCYVMCVFAVYIAAPSADVGAAVTMLRETWSGQLSKDVGVTHFGRCMVELIKRWTSIKTTDEEALATPAPSKEGIAHAKEMRAVLKITMVEGFNERVFSQEDFIALVLGMWAKNSSDLRPTQSTLTWLKRTEWFRSYLKKDTAFDAKLNDSLVS